MIFGHLFYEWHRITCSRDFDLVDEKEKKIKSFILKATYDLSNVCEDYTLCNLKYQERLMKEKFQITIRLFFDIIIQIIFEMRDYVGNSIFHKVSCTYMTL